MRATVKKKLFFLGMLISTTLVNAWEEDPRIAEHNEKTSHLLKLIESQIEEANQEIIKLLNLIREERKKQREESNE